VKLAQNLGVTDAVREPSTNWCYAFARAPTGIRELFEPANAGADKKSPRSSSQWQMQFDDLLTVGWGWN